MDGTTAPHVRQPGVLAGALAAGSACGPAGCGRHAVLRCSNIRARPVSQRCALAVPLQAVPRPTLACAYALPPPGRRLQRRGGRCVHGLGTLRPLHAHLCLQLGPVLPAVRRRCVACLPPPAAALCPLGRCVPTFFCALRLVADKGRCSCMRAWTMPHCLGRQPCSLLASRWAVLKGEATVHGRQALLAVFHRACRRLPPAPCTLAPACPSRRRSTPQRMPAPSPRSLQPHPRLHGPAGQAHLPGGDGERLGPGAVQRMHLLPQQPQQQGERRRRGRGWGRALAAPGLSTAVLRAHLRPARHRPATPPCQRGLRAFTAHPLALVRRTRLSPAASWTTCCS